MNFFKSVLSDPDPPQSPPGSPQSPSQDSTPTSTFSSAAGAGGSSSASAGSWSFGGLIKTITTKSESVIQTYRRDLEEFGSGLKKETALIRDAAARAVLDLPGSLEVGASVAQESLESVGQAIDNLGGAVWRGTSVIIRSIDADASDPETGSQSSLARRYSRFEAQVMAIQADPATFTGEPEDGEDYGKWKEGFRVEQKEEEIDGLLYESNALEALLEKLVPGVVDNETFWSRYFYRVYKLKQAEDARAKLVKRAISREEDEEDLSWEVDDEEEEEEDDEKEVKEEEKKEVVGQEVKIEQKDGETAIKDENFVPESEIVEEKKPEELEVSKVENLEVSAAASDDKLAAAEAAEAGNAASVSDEVITKSGDSVQPEAKVETAESCKDSDVSVVSSQPSMPEEDDLGWDEIEDLGEHDDKKVASSSMVSSNKADLRKRLTAAEDDEDLTWDIEDDDEQAKP